MSKIRILKIISEIEDINSLRFFRWYLKVKSADDLLQKLTINRDWKRNEYLFRTIVGLLGLFANPLALWSSIGALYIFFEVLFTTTTTVPYYYFWDTIVPVPPNPLKPLICVALSITSFGWALMKILKEFLLAPIKKEVNKLEDDG